MKKAFIIASFLLASAGVYAQRAIGSWNVQPKLGFNAASMTESEGTDPRVGLVIGGELEYQATDKVSISAGALYSQQGLKGSFDGISSTIKMDYINIPVLVNFYVAKGLALKAGLQPGFLVNDKMKASASGTSVEVGIEEAFRAGGVDASVKSLVMDVPVGISYEFSNFQIDARYNIGVSKAVSMGSESTKHQVFQLTLGYKFAL